MKISTRLTIAFLVIAGIGGMIGYIGYVGINTITKSYDSIADETAPELIILGKIDILAQKIQVKTLDYVLVHSEQTDHNHTDEELEEYQEAVFKIEQEIKNLNELEESDNSEEFHEFDNSEEKFLDDIHHAKEKLVDTSNALLHITNSNYNLKKMLELNSELKIAGDELDELIEIRMNKELLELKEKDEFVNKISEEMTFVVTVMTIGGITMSLIFGHITSRTIITPLKKLEIASKLLQKGKYDKKLEPKGDFETKNIINSFNTMSENLQSQQEKLLRTEKLYTIGKLASRLAHDLKNPLAVIQGTVEVLKMTLPNDDTIKKNTSRMDIAVARMVHQIENVLDYVRNKKLNLSKNSIKEIAEAVLKDIDVPENVSIEKSIKDITIDCDKHMMQVVFVNLVMNAIQAVGNELGIVRIKISEKNKDYITIEIQDTGIGISDNAMSQLFEPLFTTKMEGTGLGLASCKTIIEQHGGSIHVNNNPTTFSVTLPKKFEMKE